MDAEGLRSYDQTNILDRIRSIKTKGVGEEMVFELPKQVLFFGTYIIITVFLTGVTKLKKSIMGSDDTACLHLINLNICLGIGIFYFYFLSKPSESNCSY